MSILTAEDREAALSQLTTFDNLSAALSKGGIRNWRKRVPIQKDGNEIWVAVNPLTRTVSVDVPQPNPKRLALCSSEGKYGNTCYCYADQLPISIVCTVIWAVISTIILTPFSLICFIPMIWHLLKAEYNSTRNDKEKSRQHCQSYTHWCFGAFLWFGVAVLIFAVACLVFVIIIRFSY